MVKIRVSQSATGMESLLVMPISKSHAWQRSGRAGRESCGKVGLGLVYDLFISVFDYSLKNHSYLFKKIRYLKS